MMETFFIKQRFTLASFIRMTFLIFGLRNYIDHDHMVVGFSTFCAISAYHH